MADWIDEYDDEDFGGDETPRTVPMQTIFEVLKDIEDMEEPEIVMPGGVELGDIVICYGAPGSTKSAYSLMYALCAAAGREYMGHEFERPLRVWILLEEDKPNRSKLRTAFYARGLGLDPEELGDRFRITCRSFISLSRPADQEVYRRTVEEFRPDVVILDSLIQAGGIRNLNETENVREFFRDFVMPLQEDVVHSFCYVHHTNKGGWNSTTKKEVDPRGLISGSDDLLRSADAGFYFRQVKCETHGVYFTVEGVKAKDGPGADKTYYRFQSEGKGKDGKKSWLERIEISGTEAQGDKGLPDEMEALVSSEPSRLWEIAEILERLKLPETDAKRVVKAAKSNPLLEVEEAGDEVFVSYRTETQVDLDEE